MPNLYPEGYENDVVTPEDVQAKSPVGYKNGIAFNYETGDFKRDGMNKILDSTGIQSWKDWCINCLQTERYKHLAYSTDFGIELDAAMNASSREEAENILTRQISEALMADPYGRTSFVSDIAYDWEAPDTVAIELTIHGIGDVTIDARAYVTRK